MTRRGRVAAALLALAAPACLRDLPDAPGAAPAITAVQRVPANGLTVRIEVRANGMDSVRMVATAMGEEAPHATPWQPGRGGAVSIRVAGMRPSTAYGLRAEGWSGGTVVPGDSAQFTTDSLPTPLQSVHLQITGSPGPGMTLVPAITTDNTPWLLVLDSAGTIRWYLDVAQYYPGVRPNDTRQLPNGDILTNLGGSRGWDPVFASYFQFDLDGRLVRTWSVPPPLYTDAHDMILEFADTVPIRSVMLGYDIRTTDVSAFGGAANVALAGHQIIRQTLGSAPQMLFNAWDRITLADWIDEPQSQKLGPTADFDHPNAIVTDTDGNYVVSWRSLGEISKIDARTGQFIWRFGGHNNQFTFVNDPLGLFSGQHSVKALGSNRYLLYDNGLRHVPAETRVAEYQLDLAAHTATLVWEYRHTPAIFTQFIGWVQRLPSGNTFIGWGGVGVMQEVTNAKQTVWEGQLTIGGQPAPFYRAIRIVDLYTYRAP